MDATCIIRAAQPEDLLQVQELWQAVGLASHTRTPEEERDILQTHASLRVFVAVVGDKIVGTALAGTDGWWGWIYRLAVLPEHRGRGIALALVQEAERHLKAQGIRYANSVVHCENAASLRVFEKAGWSLDDCLRPSKRL